MADTRTLLDALATSLGASLGAMTGTAVRTMPTVGEVTVDWQVPIQVGGSAVGTVWLGVGQADATRLVRRSWVTPASWPTPTSSTR